MTVHRAGDLVHLTAQGHESLMPERPLSFPAPFSELPGNEHFTVKWRQIQFVFDLPDPGSFPPLGSVIPTLAQPSLRRYVSAAYEMSESMFLRHPMRFSFKFTSNSVGPITSDFPPAENVRGFATLLRQLDAKDPASFRDVQRILREANDEAGDDAQDTRRDQLSRWGKAARRLHGFQLSVLVGKELQRQGLMPPGDNMFPGEETSPHSIMSLYNNGQEIHWGDQRDSLAAWTADPLMDVTQRFNFFESLAGLAHIYMGFGLLVETALATSSD